jgi:hypothetical protein
LAWNCSKTKKPSVRLTNGDKSGAGQGRTFKLIPGDAHLTELQRDYRSMEVMIHGQIPDFAHIIDTRKVPEARINGLAEPRSL